MKQRDGGNLSRQKGAGMQSLEKHIQTTLCCSELIDVLKTNRLNRSTEPWQWKISQQAIVLLRNDLEGPVRGNAQLKDILCSGCFKGWTNIALSFLPQHCVGVPVLSGIHSKETGCYHAATLVMLTEVWLEQSSFEVMSLYRQTFNARAPVTAMITTWSWLPYIYR